MRIDEQTSLLDATQGGEEVWGSMTDKAPTTNQRVRLPPH
jgi:hypothetical protein